MYECRFGLDVAMMCRVYVELPFVRRIACKIFDDSTE